LIGQPTFGQSDKDLQDKEKFLELGEEKFREDCYKNLNSDNKLVEEFMKELTKDLPKDFAKDACETKISKIKNETATLDQNQNRILDTVTGETSYTTHIDNSNGFTVEYPTDWHVSGDKIFKGTREFTWEKHDDPTYSILDTNSFGSIWFDIKKDEDGVKITDNFGQLMMGAEPALSFSYSLLDKEYMVVALMHNNVPYVFEYGTLKENFDKDFDTMMHFIGTIRFT
jgi:hypothetical protein